jgi:hypothetical protein
MIGPNPEPELVDSIIPTSTSGGSLDVNATSPLAGGMDATATSSLTSSGSPPAELLQALADLSAKLTHIAQMLTQCQSQLRLIVERLSAGVPQASVTVVRAGSTAAATLAPAPASAAAPAPAPVSASHSFDTLTLTPSQFLSAELIALPDETNPAPAPATPPATPLAAVAAVAPVKSAADTTGSFLPAGDKHPVEVFNSLIEWITRNEARQRHFAPMASRTVASIKQKHAHLTMIVQQYDDAQGQPRIDAILESLLEDAILLDELISQERPESAAAQAMQKIRNGLVKLICDHGPYVEIRVEPGDTLADWPQPVEEYLVQVPIPHPTIPRGQVVRMVRPGYRSRLSGAIVQLAIVHVSA